MPPEFVVIAVLFVLLLIPTTVDAFVHVRGPRKGTREGVQREHLELFEVPEEDRNGGAP